MLLASVTEEYGHAGSSECNPHAPQASALEQGQGDWGEAAAATKHVWSIRTKLQIEGRARDLAMFNLAIDSKLRGCDVVAIKVVSLPADTQRIAQRSDRRKPVGRPVRLVVSRI